MQILRPPLDSSNLQPSTNYKLHTLYHLHANYSLKIYEEYSVDDKAKHFPSFEENSSKNWLWLKRYNGLQRPPPEHLLYLYQKPLHCFAAKLDKEMQHERVYTYWTSNRSSQLPIKFHPPISWPPLNSESYQEVVFYCVMYVFILELH